MADSLDTPQPAPIAPAAATPAPPTSPFPPETAQQRDTRREVARGIGRPSKLDDRTRYEFLLALRGCNTIDAAAAFAGLTRKTVYNWFRRGKRQRRGEYAEFLHAAQQAAAEAEVRMTAKVAGADDWRAAMAILERRNPKKLGWKDTVRHGIDADSMKDAPAVFELRIGHKPLGAEQPEGSAVAQAAATPPDTTPTP